MGSVSYAQWVDNTNGRNRRIVCRMTMCLAYLSNNNDAPLGNNGKSLQNGNAVRATMMQVPSLWCCWGNTIQHVQWWCHSGPQLSLQLRLLMQVFIVFVLFCNCNSSYHMLMLIVFSMDGRVFPWSFSGNLDVAMLCCPCWLRFAIVIAPCCWFLHVGWFDK